MTKLIFFGSLFMLFYIYCGYPLLVLLLSKLRPKQVHKGFYQPNITILISAYNEERHIENTIKNKLALNYPKEKIEIVVISDGSTDRTDEVVRKYANHGVKLIRQEPRAGKTSALNLGIREALGEIVVFADANSMYEKDALCYLIENFNDPEVGYVTGKMIYINSDGTIIGDGCSAYMKYENLLRNYETKLGSVVGVDGGIDAARKLLYQPMHPDQLPDFVLPLRVIEQGYRVVYEPRAVLREESLAKAEDEYRMRVRVSLRALWALFEMRQLLNSARYGLFAWQLFSHKLLRYSAFVFMGTLFVSSLFTEYWQAIMLAQLLFYGAALLALLLDRAQMSMGILYYPYYFMLLNMASGHAFIKFILGKRQTLWVPRKG